ncbi:rod shape-determining protein [Candidatus Daviesbacteria bacterium]|nr:rod shape-determining protein [Candidatus Daviesbacteria bacterium]
MLRLFNFSKRIGIDLGTANSLVYVVGEGIVMNEPSVVAVSTIDNRVLAVGNEAKEMLGRTPGNIVATRPLRDGVIADYVTTEAMLRYFIDSICGSSRIFKPEVMVCVPAGVTSVERRAVMDATLSAGAKMSYLIDEPLAAAIGANIPIANPSGNMIVDIGGGTTEAAVICLGGVVVHSSVRVGGNKIDESIVQYLRKKYGLIIGEHQSEQVKIQIGNSLKPDSTEVKQMEVRGRDGATGLPRTVVLNSAEICEAIQDPLNKIVGAVKGVLEQTPPELASDIIDKGIVMSGGTSMLTNLDKLMTQSTGVPCHISENPLLSVVLGTGLALENLDLYKRSVSRK